MGVYLQFWHCHPTGLADEFLAGPLEEFEAWCIETAAEFPDDLEPSVLPLLKAVQVRGAAALVATTEGEAAAVDGLLETYFGMFCDFQRPGLKLAADPSLVRARHFRGMFGASREAGPRGSAFDLWNFIFTGRPAGRDSSLLPYRSSDSVYHLAYWSLQEVMLLDNAFAANLASADVEPSALMTARNAVARARAKGSGLITEVA